MRIKFRNHGRRRIAYFVTAHGFGHASRSCGVMQAVLEKNPNNQFELKEFKRHIDYLKKVYQCATYHIKTEPYCQSGYSDLTVAPISRKSRIKAKAIRAKLGLGENEKVVIITMGGIRDRKDYGSSLERHSDIHFIIPGIGNKLKKQGNLTLLPHRSDFFHPDLINAVDVVIGKAGYSTIAEVYQSGNPFGYVSKPSFRETDSLVNFIKEHLNNLPISIEELSNHAWLKKVPQLFTIPKDNQTKKNGADDIADFILELLQG